MMKKWSDGDFVSDWTGSAVDPRITPDGLTRAALDACVGGPFFPGIEASWLLRDVYLCAEPFRLDHAHVEAGDVTKQMALPWQADFYDCQAEGDFGWWPSQRPDSVFPEAGGARVQLDARPSQEQEQAWSITGPNWGSSRSGAIDLSRPSGSGD